MEKQLVVPPGAEELQAYSLGKVESPRIEEIEAFLADGPDCASILEAAPEDDVVRHLRGAGELPQADLPGPSPATLAVLSRPVSPGPNATLTAEWGADARALLEHPRYRLIRKIGQGGMGTVYLAEHRLMRRLVALKLVRAGFLSNPQIVARFRREVEAAAQLAHPNIVTSHDADEAGGVHFLVMEYVEGESLAERLEREGPLPIHEACDCIRQTALGLEFAHQKGMVHRDIKSHNLMRDLQGTVKILDFGLARVLREGSSAEGPLTTEGVVMGTVDFMAPEQAQDSRHADIRADVYSLGCTLYHLLAGRVPFPGGTASSKILKHASVAPEPLGRDRADVSAELEQVIGKMMAKKPQDRYQTPAEAAAALAPFATVIPPATGRAKAAPYQCLAAEDSGCCRAVYSALCCWGLARLFSRVFFARRRPAQREPRAVGGGAETRAAPTETGAGALPDRSSGQAIQSHVFAGWDICPGAGNQLGEYVAGLGD